MLNIFNKKDARLPVEKAEPFISVKAAHHLEILRREKKATWIDVAPNQLELSIDGFNFLLTSEEDVFIVKEIFADYCYGILLADQQPCILVDIGMNIGVASCFLSQQPQVEWIYGFEPFEPTYQQLSRNMERNNLGDKTIIKNIGLGNTSRQEVWTYSRDFKGSSGKGQLSENKKNQSAQLLELPVRIELASDELEYIIKKHAGHRVIVKMDCEGGEYEIMESLAQKGLLEKIAIFMIEWHEQPAPELLKYLDHFHSFFYKLSHHTGIIHAVNSSL